MNLDVWSKDEETAIVKTSSLSDSEQDWEQVAAKMNTNRTALQCFIRHRRIMQFSTSRFLFFVDVCFDLNAERAHNSRFSFNPGNRGPSLRSENFVEQFKNVEKKTGKM